MTSFVAWVGVDSRGTASINLATDSRISWTTPKASYWDMARKTFSCSNSADIFAYVNDVTFPSMVLGQLVNIIDSGGLFCQSTSGAERYQIICSHIKNSHQTYSKSMVGSFTIFHASRFGEGLNSIFEMRTLGWDNKLKKWIESQLDIPKVSSSIVVDGSGAKTVSKWSERWESSSQGGTSRAVFSSFCNAVFAREDKLTNASPQLVSLYRKGFGKTIGFLSTCATGQPWWR